MKLDRVGVCLFMVWNVIGGSGCGKHNDPPELVPMRTFFEQNIPTVFPCLIPHDPLHKRYYLSYESFERGENSGYILSAGYTADCYGAHVCTVGYLLAERNGKAEIMQDRHGRVITTSVILADKTKAYYTPGHAMGSYFPPMLQWYRAGIWYTLSWDDRLVDRALLIKMASSICKIKND